ncbi:MAG: thiamine phosphate synthase [Sandaracinaceae bacterium]
MSFDVYLITPDASPDTVARVEAALVEERIAVLLRDPPAEHEALRRAGRALRTITRRARAPLFVHRDLELARELDADGVHLRDGATDQRARAIRAMPPGLAIGCSRHDATGLRDAARDGATFATLSPIGEVQGKGAPIGVDGFAGAIEGLDLPVFALGGVDATNAGALIRAGAAGVAVIRSVLMADEPRTALRQLLDAIDAARA